VIKLILILILGGALANGIASRHSEPPLLIDDPHLPAAAPLDASN
jgi:hypothetical protein